MTQEYCLLNYLLSGNSLTALEALQRFNCFRLSSRISDLKKKGYDIKSETITLPSGKHVSKYWIQTKVEEKGQFVFNLV